jgi:hypothetical protein
MIRLSFLVPSGTAARKLSPAREPAIVTKTGPVLVLADISDALVN